MTKRGMLIVLTAVLMLSVSCLSLFACNTDSDKPLPDVGEMIEDGQTEYKVVVPSNATSTQEYAAEQICDYFYKVTGVTLDYEADDGSEFTQETKIISLGETTAYKKAVKNHSWVDVSREKLNDDGFVMFTDGKSLFVNSYNDRGIMYGAFEFVEQNLGVKFLTADYTHIPSATTVTLKGYGKTYSSPFRQRVYLNGDVWNQRQDYVAHMRFNTDFCNMPDYMGDSTKWCYYGSGGDATHTAFRIVPPTNYMQNGTIKDEYVDCFSHTGSGKTSEVYWSTIEPGQIHDLCFTSGVNEDGTVQQTDNPTTVKLVAESLKKWIVEDEDALFYMVGQADRPNGCPCDRCREMRAKYLDSGIMMRFINCVSQLLKQWAEEEGITKEYSLVVFAYSYNEKAPVKDGKAIDDTVIPADDVYVRYAPISSAYYYSLQDERQMSEVQNIYYDWGKITNRLMIWSYHGVFTNWFWYYPTYQTFSDNFHLLATVGTVYAMGQSCFLEPQIYHDYVNAYIYSKMCWDTDADVLALRNEFLKYYFGDVAYEYMLRYHESMDERYAVMAAETGSAMRNDFSKSGMNQSGYWTYNFLNDIMSLFDEAIAAVNACDDYTDAQKAEFVSHIEVASLQPGYMRFHNAEANGYTHNEAVQLLAEWCALAEKHGATKYGENAALTIAALKAQYGIK